MKTGLKRYFGWRNHKPQKEEGNSCRSRLHAEVKCQKLEVRFTPSFVHIQFMPFWICFVHKLSLKYSALVIGKALSNNKSFYVCRVGLFYLDIFTGFGLFQFKYGMGFCHTCTSSTCVWQNPPKHHLYMVSDGDRLKNVFIYQWIVFVKLVYFVN